MDYPLRKDKKRKGKTLALHLPLHKELLCILALLASSFANTLPLIIITHGVIYVLGFLILCYPILSFLNEYWITRRGLAYGVLCSASGFSGVFFPFALEALLKRYRYRRMLRAFAVGLAAVTGPLVPLFRGRGLRRGSNPQEQQPNVKKGLDCRVAKKPLF